MLTAKDKFKAAYGFIRSDGRRQFHESMRPMLDIAGFSLRARMNTDETHLARARLNRAEFESELNEAKEAGK